MNLLAALLFVNAIASSPATETRRHLESEISPAAARFLVFHSPGDCTVKPLAAGEKARAELDVVASGATPAAERAFLDLVRLGVDEQPAATTIRSLFPPPDRKPASLSFAANLTLFLPEPAPIELENSYGRVLVEGRGGDVVVRNHLAPVEVRRVRGALHVNNEFGSVLAADIDGDATVEAKNGAVTLERIGGLARVRTTSGHVRVAGAGAADVEDRMAPVELVGIKRDAKVVAPFCAVTAREVGGNLEVDSNKEPLVVADVGGNLDVEYRSGRIDVRKVGGKATILGNLSDTTLADVAGAAEVRCPGSVVRVLNVGGALVAENSSRTLEIVDPRGDVQATGSGGLVKLRATQLPAGDAARELTLVANGGSLELELPAVGHFALDATSTIGQLENVFPEMNVVQQGTARVGTLKLGDGRLKLHATCVGGALRVRRVDAK